MLQVFFFQNRTSELQHFYCLKMVLEKVDDPSMKTYLYFCVYYAVYAQLHGLYLTIGFPIQFSVYQSTGRHRALTKTWSIFLEQKSRLY